MEASEPGTRIDTIDAARFYGIALVFYGHFIEEFMLLKNPLAAGQYKFIYSFHMILFVVLAGYVAKDLAGQMRFPNFLRNRFKTRLLPYIFFTVVMMVPPVFFEGKLFNLDLPSIKGYTGGLIATVFGLPLFCVPSWFLLLIIGLELVHFSFFRFLRNSNAKILAAALLFYTFGYLLNLKLDIFNPLKGRTIGWNYFFIHEAITLYGFYLVGVFLRRRGCFTKPLSWKISLTATVALLGVVLLTYQRNKGPFNFNVYDAVVIIFASHGHILLFPLTALAGSLMILFFADTVPTPRLVGYLGQNTLVLMCLNGVFYHYINPPLAQWLLTTFGGSAVLITASGVVTTSLSLLLCVPVVYALNRYLPQMIGKK
jgi:acyltransferase